MILVVHACGLFSLNLFLKECLVKLLTATVICWNRRNCVLGWPQFLYYTCQNNFSKMFILNINPQWSITLECHHIVRAPGLLTCPTSGCPCNGSWTTWELVAQWCSGHLIHVWIPCTGHPCYGRTTTWHDDQDCFGFIGKFFFSTSILKIRLFCF